MTVVFLTFHGLSHFHASFRIARLLSKEYAVVFAGHPSFQSYIEAQGFGYYPLKSMPFGLGFEEWTNENDKQGKIWWRSMRDRRSQRLFKERDTELTILLNSLHPARILIDAQQVTDFVVLYPHAVKRKIGLALLHTFLPQVLRKGYPPGNSLASPSDDLEVMFARTRFVFQRTYRKLWSLIKYAGRTNRAMVRNVMKANGTPLTYLSNSVGPLSIHITGLQEFILAPEEFDFSSSARASHEHYIGFMPEVNRQEKNRGSLAHLITQLDLTGKPLIYCSFGTVKGNDQQQIRRFLERLIVAVVGQPFLVAISAMVIGDYPTKDLPANIYMFNPAPQMALLKRASVFVTHGGFNSIKESIYAGVPMIVYPRDPRLDQNGNAARVTFNKLGLLGDLRKDTANEILRKVNELLRNSDYKSNVKKFRDIDERYDEQRFLKLFASLKTLD